MALVGGAGPVQILVFALEKGCLTWSAPEDLEALQHTLTGQSRC